jgi:hypothetical protein
VDTALSPSHGPRGKNDSYVSHNNDGSRPHNVFMLCFSGIVRLLVVKTKRYHHSCMDSIDDGSSPQPDVTRADMFVFLVIAIQIEHCLRDQLTDFRAKMDQIYTLVYSNMMRRFLYFTDNRNEADRTEDNCDRLCKLHVVFETLNITFSKFYKPSKSLANDEVLVLLKARVIFRQCISKKQNQLVTYIT